MLSIARKELLEISYRDEYIYKLELHLRDIFSISTKGSKEVSREGLVDALRVIAEHAIVALKAVDS